MAPRESVFTSLSPSLEDVKNAVEKIETLIAAKTFKKKLIYDMLLGFRILEQSLQDKQFEAYGLVIKWLSLFLKMQSNISTQDETVRGHFEKVVPSAVTYMIGCLQYKPKGIISYHYQLLEMIHELLSNVRPEVLEKLASFETGVIACVWFPIDFVGDFNTQMMALRLLVMLLKCVDATRLQNELDNIRCADRSVLKDKLTAAIAVANFHAAKFENTARELLNTYNMHLAQHILVYSFRCKTFKFGDNIEFYKPLNADSFWIDFNYSPRTLSFSGRCQTNNQTTYTNCSVSLQIVKLTLNQVNLSVQFEAPARLIKNAEHFPDISSISTAEIILPRDEAKRLLENKFVLKYYNRNHRPLEANLNASHVRLHSTSLTNNSENIEDDKENTTNSNNTTFDSLIPNNSNAIPSILNVENKENVPPNKGNAAVTIQRSKTDQPSSPKQFQKSYELLIGNSTEVPSQANPKSKYENIDKTKIKKKSKDTINFKLPHLPNLEKQFADDKLKSRLKTSGSKIVNYSTSTSDSNLSSENTKVSSKETVKNPRKRFFKTQSSNSDSEYNPTKTKQAPRKRNTRNKKPNASNAALKKSKKINEVKPMLQSNKNVDRLERGTSNNLLVNEISANVNAQDIITIDISESCTSNLVPDIYENHVVSDAEPGKSYRNFKIRRNSNEQNVSEIKRSRKTLPRAVKKDMPSTNRTTGITQATRTIKLGTKRSTAELMDPFDVVKGQVNAPLKVRKIETTKTNTINPTVNSAYTEVDISTAKQDNIGNAVPQRSTSNGQVDVDSVLNINNNSKTLIISNFQSASEASKASTQPLQTTINNQEVAVNKIHNLRSVSPETVKVSKNQIDDIQECRRDVGHSEMSIINDSDEFSDFPTFPNMMDISDMLPLPECESTQNKTNQTTHPTNTDLSSPTKTKASVSSNQNETTNMLESHRSLIYYSRSENDSDSEVSINSNNICEQPMKMPKHVFVTPQIPLERFRKTTSLTKCHVTTTETSIITQQDQFVHHQQFLVNIAASSNTPLNLSKSCARSTTKTTTKTVVKENKEINLNSFMRRSVNIRTPTPKALRQESSNMITNYKNCLNVQLDHINGSVNKNSANAYIQKTCDIAERMINEIERERVYLLELEANVERLSRQFSWQYEAYQRKSQQFECFKRNVETLISALNNINLLEEIKIDTRNKIQQLQQTSESIAMQQWRDFINESTENLLRDISSLSNL